MSEIVYFEVPADNVDRAKKFYSQIFDWDIEPSEHGDDYLTIDTGEEEALTGGIMKRDEPKKPITVYINVDSIDETTPRIANAGGKIIHPKVAVENMGYYAICQDTENNLFGLWEADENAM